MTQNYDLTGNTLLVDGVTATGTVSGTVTGDFPASSLQNPGTNAGTGPATFDKVLAITIGGTDYYIGLYDDND